MTTRLSTHEHSAIFSAESGVCAYAYVYVSVSVCVYKRDHQQQMDMFASTDHQVAHQFVLCNGVKVIEFSEYVCTCDDKQERETA